MFACTLTLRLNTAGDIFLRDFWNYNQYIIPDSMIQYPLLFQNTLGVLTFLYRKAT